MEGYAMTKLRQKSKKTIVAAIILGLLTTGILLGAAAPGSEQDPLVTQSWVDSYVDKECDKLESRIDSLSAAVNGGNVLCLWIGKTTFTKNGAAGTIDVPPMLVNNRTFLPFRYIGEAVGADFKWDNTEKKVTYIKGGTTIEMWIGKTDIKINGKTKTIDAAPQLTAGRTLVPIRFVMENLGAELKWDNDEKKVTIIY